MYFVKYKSITKEAINSNRLKTHFFRHDILLHGRKKQEIKYGAKYIAKSVRGIVTVTDRDGIYICIVTVKRDLYISQSLKFSTFIYNKCFFYLTEYI